MFNAQALLGNSALVLSASLTTSSRSQPSAISNALQTSSALLPQTLVTFVTVLAGPVLALLKATV